MKKVRRVKEIFWLNFDHTMYVLEERRRFLCFFYWVSIDRTSKLKEVYEWAKKPDVRWKPSKFIINYVSRET